MTGNTCVAQVLVMVERCVGGPRDGEVHRSTWRFRGLREIDGMVRAMYRPENGVDFMASPRDSILEIDAPPAGPDGSAEYEIRWEWQSEYQAYA